MNNQTKAEMEQYSARQIKDVVDRVEHGQRLKRQYGPKPPSQASLADQLVELALEAVLRDIRAESMSGPEQRKRALIALANLEGLYDAADYLTQQKG